LNQLACISRKIGASARSSAGAGAGGGGGGGIAARAAPQPDGLGLVGLAAAGMVVPSGMTKPIVGVGFTVGYATVGDPMAAAVDAAGTAAAGSAPRTPRIGRAGRAGGSSRSG
jgi:hypothetical protein